MSPTAPSFDEWLTYCFEQGHADATAGFPEDDREKELYLQRRERFLHFDKEVVSDYVERLFLKPGDLVERYPDGTLAEGIRFLFGTSSGILWDALDELAVKEPRHIAVMRSLGSFYTGFLDRVCNGRGDSPDRDMVGDAPVDAAVHGIWEMGCIEVPLLAPERYPNVAVPCLEMLEHALRSCRTATCKGSILLALGHAQVLHGPEVQMIIDRYLKRSSEPDHLVRMAHQARVGHVQPIGS